MGFLDGVLQQVMKVCIYGTIKESGKAAASIWISFHQETYKY